jgi:NAD(P)-dependent dehydrogenase (short-subunit alcohol dehydrogenase family)
MDARGKVALVTGGRRVGAVVALALARAGADIALSYNRSRDEAEATASEARAAGRRAFVRQADLADPAACRELVDATAANLGRLDILVSMASVYRQIPFETLAASDLQHSFDVEVKSALACALAAAPLMRGAGGGRIILVSDWLAASQRPRYTGFLHYYVAKKAVVGLAEALALELAADQVLVNAVAPGPILPPPDLQDEESKAVEQATPVGRWGGADEIAKTILALVDSDFITGETIRVDGGRHVR